MKKEIKTNKEFLDGLSEWEAWLFNNADTEHESKKFTGFDHVCELAVQNYLLDSKSRKQALKDQVHYFLLWWKKNKRYMKKYTSTINIGALLKIDHSNVIHYTGRVNEPDSIGDRKPSLNFEDNTKCIKDFLES